MGALHRSSRRTLVLQALQAQDGFVTAQQLYTHLTVTGARIGMSTVYRTLHLLADLGHADIVHDPHHGHAYRYRPTTQHRHYLRCRHCDAHHDLDTAVIEEWTENVSAAFGYLEVHHTVQLTGTCPTCAQRPHGPAT